MVIMVRSPRLYTVDGHPFIHVPKGRGEELLIHLASHGIESRVSAPDFMDVERLDLKGDVDPEVIQALLDEWEG
jgi:hypothetical protein